MVGKSHILKEALGFGVIFWGVSRYLKLLSKLFTPEHKPRKGIVDITDICRIKALRMGLDDGGW